MTTPTLLVKGLQTHFFSQQGIIKAIDGIDFQIAPGEIMGLVGESGSGKSMTGFSILGLIDSPGKIVAGEIIFQQQDLCKANEKIWQTIRGNRIAMIFQDPMMTLNPVLTIETQMQETLYAHQPKLAKHVAQTKILEMLTKVGIPSPKTRLKSYPHELSGGMRQRIVIAIALLNEPDLIIADEPTTALDVTVQSQIISEMQTICRESNTSLIWITHDLSVVASLADSICVMYAGKIIEQGKTHEILTNPAHPYTQGLIDAVPNVKYRGKPLPQIPGATPSLLNLPDGCSFASRCQYASQQCQTAPTITILTQAHRVRCFHPLAHSLQSNVSTNTDSITS